MSLINLMQCPGCLCPLRPPVFLCPKGHGLCRNCQVGGVCTACGSPLSGKRHLDAERLALRLPYACLNDGCPEQVILAQMPEHNAICPYRLYTCLPGKPNCLWRGFRSAVLEHIRDEHPELLWNKPYTSVEYENFDPTTTHSCTHAILAHDHLFWYHSRRDAAAGKLLETVQLVGPRHLAKTFKFVMEFYRQGDADKLLVFSNRVYVENENLDSVFGSGNCLTLDLNMVNSFVDENKRLFYNLKVEDSEMRDEKLMRYNNTVQTQ